MTDLKGPPLPDDVRAVLDCLPAERPPSDVEARLLGRIEAALGPPTGGGSGSSPPDALASPTVPSTPLGTPLAAGLKASLGTFGIPLSVATLVLGGITGAQLQRLSAAPQAVVAPARPPELADRSPTLREGDEQPIPSTEEARPPPHAIPRTDSSALHETTPRSGSLTAEATAPRTDSLRVQETPRTRAIPAQAPPRTDHDAPRADFLPAQEPPPTSAMKRDTGHTQVDAGATAPPQQPRSDDTLALERLLITEAQSALARRAAPQALAALSRHERFFPSGALAEERDALWIQALVQGGHDPEAQARGRLFRAEHPDSLLLPMVEQALRSIP